VQTKTRVISKNAESLWPVYPVSCLHSPGGGMGFSLGLGIPSNTTVIGFRLLAKWHRNKLCQTI